MPIVNTAPSCSGSFRGPHIRQHRSSNIDALSEFLKTVYIHPKLLHLSRGTILVFLDISLFLDGSHTVG